MCLVHRVFVLDTRFDLWMTNYDCMTINKWNQYMKLFKLDQLEICKTGKAKHLSVSKISIFMTRCDNNNYSHQIKDESVY